MSSRAPGLRRLAAVAAALALLIALAALSLTAARHGTAARALSPLPAAAPGAGLDLRAGSALPLQLPFVDTDGRTRPLADAFGARPVLLVLGYYRCPQLCGLLMHGLLEALQAGGLPPTAYRIVRVSIDPAETPADARAQRRADLAYAAFLQPPQPPVLPELCALTGNATSVHGLADALGWRWQALPASDDASPGYAHPAAVIVASPDGRALRSLGGVRFDARQLREAIVAAAGPQPYPTAAPAPGDAIALLCGHLGIAPGRFDAAVRTGLQAAGLAGVLALALWLRRLHRASPPRDGMPTTP